MFDEFSAIYREKQWHPTLGSGSGSDPARLGEYLALLQGLLRDEGVGSVADLGCGDWSFSRYVDWSGIEYVGVDVVEMVADLDRTYARPGIRFERADIARDPLPEADLAVVKDVLQHWPTRHVRDFLERLGQYPLVLLTNDVHISARRRWWPFGSRMVVPANGDIPVGGYRPIRLRDEPFGLSAECLGTFEVRDGPFRFLKEVLLLRRGPS